MDAAIQPKVISRPMCLKMEWSIDRIIPDHRVKAPRFILIPLEHFEVPCIVGSNRPVQEHRTEEAERMVQRGEK